jgi:ornithine cyclodeaminase/alanine dehydrogenase-like protein (mu-crystallin family)
MQLRILSAQEVRQALPMEAAIRAMKGAFQQLAREQVDLPLRTMIEVPEQDGAILFMPALLRETHDVAVKVVSVFPHNPQLDLPTINAVVIGIDARTGQPAVMLEGASLTAIRTGAVSGAATDLLAREDARVAAIFGSGVQARTQLEAVCTVRAIEEVWVYSLVQDEVAAYIDEMRGQGPIPEQILAASSPSEAVHRADIICTATTATKPVFDGNDLKPGAHINAIGAFTPGMREVDETTLERALVIVDSLESARKEAGDLIIPIDAGAYSWDRVHAELGELLTGAKPGRENARQVTLFKSVGLAIQDAAAARGASEGARSAGLGRMVEL